MKKTLKKIAVINFGGIGDLVIAIPFIRGLKRSFPESSISVICPKKTGEILRGQPYIDSLHMTDMRPFSVFQFILKMRCQRFDLAINMMPMHSLGSSIKMFLLFFLLNAKKTAGRNTGKRGLFFDLKSEENETQIENEMENHNKLLLAVGGSLLDSTLEYHISIEFIKSAKKIFTENNVLDGKPIVAINPGSDWPSRRWPFQGYADVMNRLKTRFPDIRFVIIGTKKEQLLAEILRQIVGECVISLSGKTDIMLLPALLKSVDLLITNESGPSHLAKAIGVPVLTLSGPSHPAFILIKANNDSVIIRHQVPCSPCLKKECDDMKCWAAITVDEVFEQAVSLIERNCSR